MNSVRQSCRPKHQVLILKCYPRFQKGVQSVKPNSSELSYLLYYASTRRSKLQKVGVFLEKRAARDVWRGKIGNVQVTLQILAALIEKVPRDLPLYARSVITVLETVLRSREITMVEETIPTFELFCRHQDSATLTADHEYINQYRETVRTYASFASTETPVVSKTPMSAPMALRWRTVGLKAIKSIVASEMLSTDGAKQLNVVIPVILQNLYASGDPGLSPLQEKAKSSEKLEREQLRRRRMSISTIQTVDTIDGYGDPESASSSAADADRLAEVEARVLALRCLEKVFSGTNRVQIRFATSLVLSFIVSRRPPRNQEKGRNSNGRMNGNWATNLLEVIANWTPVQDRFIILVTLLEALVGQPLIDGHLESQLILASMLDWLLSSSINLIGLSVMDVLIGLLHFIHLLLQLEDGTQKSALHYVPSPFVKPLPQLEEPTVASSANDDIEKVSITAPMRHELLELLGKCVGDLATHIYYGDQVSDMIRAIITRIKPSPVLEGEHVDREVEPDNGKQSPPRSDYTAESYFSFPSARVTALKAIKDTLIVANLRKSISGSDSSSRNRVPLQVWEGTQWLLRDPEREVRNAYVDALLSWLQLETNKTDLRVSLEHTRASKISNKKDVSDISERLARRIVSNASQRENGSAGASSFLQLLHLTIFDVVTELSITDSDILVLHLLLANMVEHMGVNAVRYTLPVLMKLQTLSVSSSASMSPTRKLQISSLVHGYLLAVVEKFDLEGTRVGNEIINEISKRKSRGIWLDKLQLPPRPLNHIRVSLDTKINQESLSRPDKDVLCPFTSLDELVTQIETSYNSSYVSPPTSPSSSPGRSFTLPSFGHNNATQSATPGSQLPLHVKEQMLAQWSKEDCLAAIEREKAKASSLSGSRTATGRNAANLSLYRNAPGSPAGTTPSVGNQQDRPVTAACPATGGLGSIRKTRRQSVPERRSSPATSSRESTVRVSELRRVLSVVNNHNVRQPSPLRHRDGVDSTASSVESMVSYNLSISDAGTAGPDRPLSPPGNSRTPRSSNTQLGGNRASDHLYDDTEPDDIPPVPPLPSSLAIPGGFPADSRRASSASSPLHSPIRSDRPSTAPGRQPRTPSSTSTIRQSRSLTRNKSLNVSLHDQSERKGEELNGIPGGHIHGYSEDMSDIGIAITADTTETVPQSQELDYTSSRWSRREASRTLSFGRRVDVDDLLEGLAIRSDGHVKDDGEITGAESSSRAAEGARISPRTGKRPALYSASNGYQTSYQRKSGLLAPSSAPWNRTSSDIRGGIGPPPY
ncbi:plasma membrane localization protein [Emydomyces testavorans]|uniref:Plasma membrane localization protein n=1 Tax=Emydomyces testavorans TaxID=2070801 RepID=A0AAF0DB51_9EURO|nr:plasma membrane localization protein [Emydomyces testavorans]